MWNSHIEVENGGKIRRISILCDREALRYSEVLEHWCSDAGFRGYFIRLLADAPFPAYFWETPPITRASVDQLFECVLVDSPGLDGVAANRQAFAEYFAAAQAGETVVSFPSLGKDACLIVPCPGGSAEACAHLASFSRDAPESQQHALWHRVGTTALHRLSERPLWISTSGLGIYWLHVRLDSRPKYYTYPPYTRVAG